MPERIIHCKICGKGIKGYGFEERMEKLRKHLKKAHPRKFKESIKKGVETRKRNMED